METLLPSEISIMSPPIHYLVQLKIFLRTARMGIVTSYAGLADGAVSVDGLEIGLIADLDRTGGRLFWMFTHSF